MYHLHILVTLDIVKTYFKMQFKIRDLIRACDASCSISPY